MGFAGLYAFGGPTVEVGGMVHPNFRRRGIGGRLLDEARQLCQERGSRKLLLVIPRSSPGGRALAESRGGYLEHSEHALELLGASSEGPSDPSLCCDQLPVTTLSRWHEFWPRYSATRRLRGTLTTRASRRWWLNETGRSSRRCGSTNQPGTGESMPSASRRSTKASALGAISCAGSAGRLPRLERRGCISRSRSITTGP